MQTLTKKIQEAGYRMTMARRAVVELFERNDEPMSAVQILEFLSQLGVRVNKTTVYRELSFLTEQGYVEEVDLGGRGKRYERAREHHHHVVCIECNEIEHIDVEDEIRALERKLERRLGGAMQRHLIEFFRLCPRCVQR